jgi:hypothetical protein
MDTLPLPPRPDLAQYRKRAKALVVAAHSADPDAVRTWAREWLDALVKLLNVEITAFVRDSIDRAVSHIEKRVRATRDLALSDAQFLIAEAHGFATWGDFARHIEPGESTDPFELAADAVVAGDIATLSALLREHPDLIHAHSKRVHHATLLHYVAANGVEDFRQKTPPNAVAVARLLLEAGAKVDALADTYGSDWYQTTMNLLVSSTHPHDAGLMSALVEVLLDHGAAINGLRDDETPILTALDFGYVNAAETLARRGARVDSVVTAAALGRVDFLREHVVDAKTVAPGTPLVAPPWRKLPNDAAAHIELAFAWSCKFARTGAAQFFLDVGANIESADGFKMTALHWAASNGMATIVEQLLGRGAQLEVENMWEGTVLGSTLHFAVHMPTPGVDYAAMVKRLLEAGANARAVEYPTKIPAIDALLRQHGAES